MKDAMVNIVRLTRPKQWVKNLFVMLPLFFAAELTHVSAVLSALSAFAAFSLMASAVYCLNDLVDADADRSHPIKCRRPIASGDVSRRQAVAAMIVLASASLAVARSCSPELAGVIGAYAVLNVAYCLWLKHYAIVDVTVIAAGFVLRLAAGGVACGIWLSPWIVCMTFLLALFLAFAKRRDDVLIHESTGQVMRRSAERYNVEFLNQTLGVLAAVMLVCYVMYTMSPAVEARLHSENLYFTSVFVLAAILRYLQVTLVDRHSGSPTAVILRDRFLQCCIAGWLATFAIIIYL